MRELDSVLWPARARNAGYYCAEVEFQILAVSGLNTRVVPQPLGLGVGLHQVDQLDGPSRQPQIVQSDVVNREHRRSGAKLGAHVSNGGAISQRHFAHSGAIEFDELAHHAVCTQHLGDREDNIGRGHSRGNCPL